MVRHRGIVIMGGEIRSKTRNWSIKWLKKYTHHDGKGKKVISILKKFFYAISRNEFKLTDLLVMQVPRRCRFSDTPYFLFCYSLPLSYFLYNIV